MRKKLRSGKNLHYSISKKLQKDNKINDEFEMFFKTKLNELGVYPQDLIPYWVKREALPAKVEKETQELSEIPPDDAPEGTTLQDIDEDDETN